MKTVFAYIRVSTQKQGVQGSSLQEQRTAISAYAVRNNLTIAEWFEEMETAAKRGRPKFRAMMKGLEVGTASGVVIHKIDRSARNLRDWADLGDLIDRGIEVHFAHESLDLHSRGGRLSADIQAVVAADFIRNLRQEVKKGISGRLNQGLYPRQAPIGYRDMGKGKRKEIDPIQGPLVREAFQLYASGEYNFARLVAEMHGRGLRGQTGNRITKNTLTAILNNPFYMGIIHVKATGESFPGAHEPLITKALFDQAQKVLRTGRAAGSAYKHDFLFRRLICCVRCGWHLIAERQKGRYVYYRCHNPVCETVSINERVVDDAMRELCELLRIEDGEMRDIREISGGLFGQESDEKAKRHAALKLQLANCDERLARLTDVLIDGAIDKEVFNLKKDALLRDKRSLLDQMDAMAHEPSQADRLAQNLELANTAYIQYKSGIPVEKRALVESLTSNFTGQSNYPVITLKSPFQEMVEWRISDRGAPCRDDGRTRARKILGILGGVGEEEINTAVSKRKLPKNQPRWKRNPNTSLHRSP